MLILFPRRRTRLAHPLTLPHDVGESQNLKLCDPLRIMLGGCTGKDCVVDNGSALHNRVVYVDNLTS